MTLPLTELAQRATVRLIPSAHYKPPVLQPLVDTQSELTALEKLEGKTSGRLVAQKRGLPDLDPRELVFRARAYQLRKFGETYVNSAFTYSRAGGNRFNAGDRGAWYCAFEDLVAIEEVGFHRTRELEFTGELHDEALYQAFLADLIGEFPDLRRRDEVATTPTLATCLDPDPGIGYPAGQTLARALREAGHTGLIYPSVRALGGICFVAFDPKIVQNVRPGAKWWLKWTGSLAFTVTTAA